MRHDLHLDSLEKLRSLGYCVIWRLCDSLELGIPQPRPRVWFCGWLKSPIPDVTSFGARVQSAMASLFHDHPMMDIDEFLLPEDHDGLLAGGDLREKQLAKKKVGKSGPTWIEYQREKYDFSVGDALACGAGRDVTRAHISARENDLAARQAWHPVSRANGCACALGPQ